MMTQAGKKGDPALFATLTRREQEVILLLAEGQSAEEIATTLKISTATVDFYRRQVVRKVGAASIKEALVRLTGQAPAIHIPKPATAPDSVLSPEATQAVEEPSALDADLVETGPLDDELPDEHNSPISEARTAPALEAPSPAIEASAVIESGLLVEPTPEPLPASPQAAVQPLVPHLSTNEVEAMLPTWLLPDASEAQADFEAVSDAWEALLPRLSEEAWFPPLIADEEAAADPPSVAEIIAQAEANLAPTWLIGEEMAEASTLPAEAAAEPWFPQPPAAPQPDSPPPSDGELSDTARVLALPPIWLVQDEEPLVDSEATAAQIDPEVLPPQGLVLDASAALPFDGHLPLISSAPILPIQDDEALPFDEDRGPLAEAGLILPIQDDEALPFDEDRGPLAEAGPILPIREDEVLPFDEIAAAAAADSKITPPRLPGPEQLAAYWEMMGLLWAEAPETPAPRPQTAPLPAIQALSEAQAEPTIPSAAAPAPADDVVEEEEDAPIDVIPAWDADIQPRGRTGGLRPLVAQPDPEPEPAPTTAPMRETLEVPAAQPDVLPLRDADDDEAETTTEPTRPARFERIHRLPTPPTTLIGRAALCADVAARLPAARWLTLTGDPGIGKTRVAIHAAELALESFPDGVVFVSLEALTNPALVPSVLARALGIAEARGRRVETLLVYAFLGRRLLLVLDHLDGAPTAAAQIAELLQSADGVHVLAVCREPLRLPGEQVVQVGPLETTLPRKERRDRQPEVVELFVERAVAAAPGYQFRRGEGELLARLGAALRGNPLALELLAARITVYAPQVMFMQVDNRLRSAQGASTLESVLGWCANLLARDELLVYSALSLFAGHFSVAEAQAALGGALNLDLGRLIEGLAKRCLLVKAYDGVVVSYRMPPAIAEHAARRLNGLEEAGALARAYVVYYAERAAAAARLLAGAERERALLWLDEQAPNWRAALQLAAARKLNDLLLRLTEALWPLWDAAGLFHEAMLSVDQALGVGGAVSPAQIGLRLAAAGLAYDRRDYERARGMLEEMLVMCKITRDRTMEARLLQRLGEVALAQGDNARAVGLFETSLALAQEVQDAETAAAARAGLKQAQ